MADLSRHPKPVFFFFFCLRGFVSGPCIRPLSHTLSLTGTKSPLTLVLSNCSVLALAAMLMTFILMEMEKEEKALDADLDTHIHLRRADINRLATFMACMLSDSDIVCLSLSLRHTHADTHTTHIHTHMQTHLPCSVLSLNWPPVKIRLILWGLYFLLAELG